jgi:hypothetical protein
MTTETAPEIIGNSQEEIDDILLDLLPRQGHWSEEHYLWLTDHSTRLIEYTDGYLEVLPMPTDEHHMFNSAYRSPNAARTAA